jgi:hypothetical protein
MPGRLTVWGAGQLLTTYFSRTTTPPPAFYLALIKAIPPTPYMSGAELDEPDATDYQRVIIENDLANWTNSSQPQEIFNVRSINFITATSTWGQIKYWALCNAAQDGYNMLIGNLENPVMIEAGDVPMFADGDLSVSLGPFFMAEEA